MCNLGALKAGEANLELRRAADGRQLAREKSCQETSRWKPDKEAQRPTTTTAPLLLMPLPFLVLLGYPRQYEQGGQQKHGL